MKKVPIAGIFINVICENESTLVLVVCEQMTETFNICDFTDCMYQTFFIQQRELGLKTQFNRYYERQVLCSHTYYKSERLWDIHWEGI